MPRVIPIRRPDRHLDSPSAKGLAFLAVCGLAGGMVLSARLTSKPASPPAIAPHAGATATTLAATEPADLPSQAPAVAPPPVVPVVAAPAPDSDTTTRVTATSTAGAVRIERGRIAYIRCEGIAQGDGVAACPRDAAMERTVWAAIDALATRCPALGATRGAADVRVVFDGRRFSGLGYHPSTPEALATATRGCLEPALTGVMQTVGATRLTASFRFEAK